MYLTNQNPNLPFFFHGKICLLNLIVGFSQGSGNLRYSTLAAKLIHSPAAGLLHNTIKYYMHFMLPSLAYLVVMPKSHFFPVDVIIDLNVWRKKYLGFQQLSQFYFPIND